MINLRFSEFENGGDMKYRLLALSCLGIVQIFLPYVVWMSVHSPWTELLALKRSVFVAIPFFLALPIFLWAANEVFRDGRPLFSLSIGYILAGLAIIPTIWMILETTLKPGLSADETAASIIYGALLFGALIIMMVNHGQGRRPGTAVIPLLIAYVPNAVFVFVLVTFPGLTFADIGAYVGLVVAAGFLIESLAWTLKGTDLFGQRAG